MNKRLLNGLLMAAVILSLSMSVTSCKDDDNDGGTDIGGETTMEVNLSDDEAVLAWLLQSFCDFDAQDAGSGLLDKTYNPVVGEVADESQPTIRAIVMGTQEAADEYASKVLSVLGAGNSPVGFSWKNDAIGTVSYQHGSGNELGVLNLSIKQIPSLTQILLTKNGDGNAQNRVPYYHRGDIIKYTKDNKYYLCVSDHQYGEKSRWISFDATKDEELDQRINICRWSGIGNDTVYCDAQASSATLTDWIEYFLLNDKNYNDVIAHIKAKQIPGGNKEKILNQLIPYEDEQTRRTLFVNAIKNENPESTAVLEAWKKLGEEEEPRGTKWRKIPLKNQPKVDIYTPHHLLLCNTMRWSMGRTFDYWVPYILLVPYKEQECVKFENLLDDTPSQNNTGINGHFKWKFERSFSVEYGNTFPGTYAIYTVAVHWTHQKIETAFDAYGILNFTTMDERNTNLWRNRCITSHEITFADKGAANSKFEEIYHERQGIISNAQEGDWIDKDGNIYRYDNKPANAVAMVAYVGPEGTAETGTQYRGLAIGLKDLYVGGGSYGDKYRWCEDYSVDFGECTVNSINDDSMLWLAIDGITSTNQLVNGCGNNHDHPAAKACREYNAIPADVRRANGMSDWFLPSMGQWLLIMQYNNIEYRNKYFYNDGLRPLFDHDSYGFDYEEYASSTRAIVNKDGNQEERFWVIDFENMCVNTLQKSQKVSVRPMIAF